MGLGDDIQHAGGLIQQNDFGLHDHDAGQRRPLQLAARQVARGSVQMLLMQAKALYAGNERAVVPGQAHKAEGLHQTSAQGEHRVKGNLGVLKEDLDLPPGFASKGIF